MITKVDDYFAKGCGRCERFATPDCSTRQWIEGLHMLRRICLDVGLHETAKWGHPCYMHAGRNVALLGAFRDDFRLTFFHAALLHDTSDLLEKAGPNSQHPSLIRFTNVREVNERKATLRSYLEQAMAHAAAGTVPPREERDLDLPDELIEALDADPEMAEAFHALTPGRQRSYVIHLSSAKKSETRISRIAKARHKILEGRGFNER